MLKAVHLTNAIVKSMKLMPFYPHQFLIKKFNYENRVHQYLFYFYFIEIAHMVICSQLVNC